MSAPEGGQVNLNCPAQDKKFQANRAQDLWIQKSLSSDRVAPVKQLEELVERRIGCSGGIVKDQPSLSFVSYRRTVDGDLLLKLQTGEYYVPTLEDGSSKFLQSVNVLPKLSKLPGEHEGVYMWVLSCFVFYKHIRLFSRDVCVSSCLVIMPMKYVHMTNAVSRMQTLFEYPKESKSKLRTYGMCQCNH